MRRLRRYSDLRATTENARVVVQIIVVQWTKRARGGPLAIARNRVPERFALPAALVQGIGAANVVLHTMRFDQSNVFTSPIEDTIRQVDDLPVLLDSCIQLVLHEERLMAKLVNYAPYVPAFPPEAFREHPGIQNPSAPVRLEPTIVTAYHGMGAPSRSVPLAPLVLRRGEWGRVRYLGRHAVLRGQHHVYRKYVYNIGWLWNVSERVFVETEPNHHYDSMPNVW